MNHFEKMFRQKTRTKQINELEANTDELFCIGTFEVVNKIKVIGPEEWWVDAKVNNKSVKFKIDTGAKYYVLPVDFYK